MNGETNTVSEPHLFRREGAYWTIVYAGITIRLRDMVGMHYLARLLAQPDQRVATTELLAAVRGTSGIDSERARWAVSKRIHAVITLIREHHPTLGHHLAVNVHTGRECAYRPDPTERVQWSL